MTTFAGAGWGSETVPASAAKDQAVLKERAEAEVAGLVPGAWTPVTLPAAVEAVAEHTPEVRLVSATTEPGNKVVEFRGKLKVKTGKAVKTGDEILAVSSAFKPAATRVTGVLSIPTTGKATNTGAELKEGEELDLAGSVYAL